MPADYVLGPGDVVNVQLFGSQNDEVFLPVTREGTINFPELGPVSVSGMTFAELRDLINERVREQMIGVRASVTLGELRSIRVFLLGDVVKPGSYTVSGLSTITNALYASGGVSGIGSLRNVELRRDGTTSSTLDLYDLLLRGDTSGDMRLQAGDVVFVPPIGAQGHGGWRGSTPCDLRGQGRIFDCRADCAGRRAQRGREPHGRQVGACRGESRHDCPGYRPREERRDAERCAMETCCGCRQSSATRKLRAVGGQRFPAGPLPMAPGHAADRSLAGPGARQADVGFELRTDTARSSRRTSRSRPFPRICRRAWRHPAAPKTSRCSRGTPCTCSTWKRAGGQIVAPLIEELNSQADSNEALPVVRVGGQVRLPGEYPLEPGMRVSDLLRAGGGLSAAAYATDAELTRYTVVGGEYRETEFVTVNLASVLRGDAAADLAVGPYDYLNIKEVSRWRGEETVTIRGEVVFPGTYPIRRGEKLSSLLARAGGLTDLAFPEGSVFTRYRATRARARAARGARPQNRARSCRRVHFRS